MRLVVFWINHCNLCDIVGLRCYLTIFHSICFFSFSIIIHEYFFAKKIIFVSFFRETADETVSVKNLWLTLLASIALNWFNCSLICGHTLIFLVREHATKNFCRASRAGQKIASKKFIRELVKRKCKVAFNRVHLRYWFND